MTPELISAIFTGLTALIAALAALTANRSKRIELDQKAMKRRLRLLERQVQALLKHVYDLENIISIHGDIPPPRPHILEEEDEDGKINPPTR